MNVSDTRNFAWAPDAVVTTERSQAATFCAAECRRRALFDDGCVRARARLLVAHAAPRMGHAGAPCACSMLCAARRCRVSPCRACPDRSLPVYPRSLRLCSPRADPTPASIPEHPSHPAHASPTRSCVAYSVNWPPAGTVPASGLPSFKPRMASATVTLKTTPRKLTVDLAYCDIYKAAVPPRVCQPGETRLACAWPTMGSRRLRYT